MSAQDFAWDEWMANADNWMRSLDLLPNGNASLLMERMRPHLEVRDSNDLQDVMQALGSSLHLIERHLDEWLRRVYMNASKNSSKLSDLLNREAAARKKPSGRDYDRAANQIRSELIDVLTDTERLMAAVTGFKQSLREAGGAR